MSDRRPYKRQAERDIDRPGKIHGLYWNKALIVVHRNGGVAIRIMKKGIGGIRTIDVDIQLPRPLYRPRYFNLFASHHPLLACVRVND